MVNIVELGQFLIDSNKAGYAGGEQKKWIKEADLSTTIPFEKSHGDPTIIFSAVNRTAEEL